MTHAIAFLGSPAQLVGWRNAWRLRRLTQDRTRQRLASGLLRVIEDAEASPGGISSAIPVQRRAVPGCRGELLDLADRLRSPRPAYAQGVELVQSLLTEAASPLYQADGDLAAAVTTALAALDGHLA